MKKAALLAMFFCFTSLPLYAFGSHSNTHTANCAQKNGINGCTLSATGAIRLSRMDKDIMINIEPNIKGNVKVFHSEANNRDSIRGAFFLNNTSKQKVYIKYRLVFKDKIGVIAQSTGEIHLKPGSKQRKKFGNIVLSEQDIKNINSYQIHMVVSNTPSFKR